MKRIDIVGKRYGRLLVLSDAGISASGKKRFLCRCDCGQEKSVLGVSLQRGATRSCGCLQREGIADFLKIGQKYGQLTVTREAPRAKNGEICYVCSCDCGRETIVCASRLRSGNTRSCGCLRRLFRRSHIHMIGEKHGRLTVLREVPNMQGMRSYLCLCECGQEKVVLEKALRSGDTRSCGCLQVEAIRQRATKHGATQAGCVTPEYRTWKCMWSRVRCTSGRTYKNYAERGITVCERWKSFEAFLADMGPKPSPKHSIDRVNNDGNYEPGNCRWATPSQQLCNRRMLDRNTSGVAGVSWHKQRQKWRAQIGGVPSGESDLGLFANIEDAARACSAAKAERDCSY